MHTWLGISAEKYPVTLGFMVLFVSSMTAISWTAALLVVGSGLAVLTAWVMVWQTGSRQARVALASPAGMFRNPLPVDKTPVLFVAPTTGSTVPQDIIAQDIHEQPQTQQVETVLRRAAVSRFASRRLLARRPIPGPRRHHLRRWGHR